MPDKTNCPHLWWISGKKEVCELCDAKQKHIPPEGTIDLGDPCEPSRIEKVGILIGYILHGFQGPE